MTPGANRTRPDPARRRAAPGHACLRAARGVATALLVAVAGCSSLPTDDHRTVSIAFADTAGTRLARAVDAGRPAAVDPAWSGLRLVAHGDEAYGDLYALISRAERSLDLQYYIIKDDPSARALLRAARAAADRGVRVRVLLDDFYTSGQDDLIAWYASHPNIEVRLFNPFAHGRAWFAARLVTSLFDVGRIDRRMHNKLFVVDNAIALTGGRNIGAEYYTRSSESNFLDLDMMAGGPVVHALSDAFDGYWNSAFAVPIERFARAGAPPPATIDAAIRTRSSRRPRRRRPPARRWPRSSTTATCR